MVVYYYVVSYHDCLKMGGLSWSHHDGLKGGGGYLIMMVSHQVVLMGGLSLGWS